MKNRTRSLLCMVLVTMLIASLVVPAIAAPVQGSGTCGGVYDFTYTIEKKSTTGVANITTPHTPAYVTATVQNTLNYKAYGKNVKVSDSLTGYARATATAGNTFTHEGSPMTASIKSTTAEFKVNGEVVLPLGSITIGDQGGQSFNLKDCPCINGAGANFDSNITKRAR